MEKVPADQRLRSRVLDQHLRDAIYSFIADCGNNIGNPNRPPGEAVADSGLKSRPLGLGRTGAVVGETGAVAARQDRPALYVLGLAVVMALRPEFLSATSVSESSVYRFLAGVLG